MILMGIVGVGRCLQVGMLHCTYHMMTSPILTEGTSTFLSVNMRDYYSNTPSTPGLDACMGFYVHLL